MSYDLQLVGLFGLTPLNYAMVIKAAYQVLPPVMGILIRETKIMLQSWYIIYTETHTTWCISN